MDADPAKQDTIEHQLLELRGVRDRIRLMDWTECRRSLVAAIGRWAPSRIVLAFAVDLSEGPQRTFESELIEHSRAREKRVAIEQWNVSELVRRLAQHSDLRIRFFPATDSFREQIVRGVKAGGDLQNAGDLVERARTLGEYAQQRDLDFAYRVMASPVEGAGPGPEWPEPPYLYFKLSDGRHEVDLMAWPRESADVEAPGFAFTADAEGQAARGQAIRGWGRGEQGTISSGARVRFTKPELVDELLAGSTLGQGMPHLAAPDSFDAVPAVTGPDGVEHEFSFEARVVPPLSGAFDALTRYIGDVFVHVNVETADDGRARANFSLSTEFSTSADRSLATAELIVLWADRRRLRLRSVQMYEGGRPGETSRRS